MGTRLSQLQVVRASAHLPGCSGGLAPRNASRRRSRSSLRPARGRSAFTLLPEGLGIVRPKENSLDLFVCRFLTFVKCTGNTHMVVVGKPGKKPNQ